MYSASGRWRMRRHNSRPSVRGIIQSLTTTRNGSIWSASHAASPSAASTVSWPRRRSACRSTARDTASSLTARIFMGRESE